MKAFRITAKDQYIQNMSLNRGKTIHLGIDHSTGSPREDKAEHYEEVVDESEFLKNRR